MPPGPQIEPRAVQGAHDLVVADLSEDQRRLLVAARPVDREITVIQLEKTDIPLVAEIHQLPVRVLKLVSRLPPLSMCPCSTYPILESTCLETASFTNSYGIRPAISSQKPLIRMRRASFSSSPRERR